MTDKIPSLGELNMVKKVSEESSKYIREIYYTRKSDEGHVKVRAFCVQGETGFLAFFLDRGGFVHVLAGDDGQWWELWIFQNHWLEQILTVLQAFCTYIRVVKGVKE